MSYSAQFEFIEITKSIFPEMFVRRRVLEIGSFDINDSIRHRSKGGHLAVLLVWLCHQLGYFRSVSTRREADGEVNATRRVAEFKAKYRLRGISAQFRRACRVLRNPLRVTAFLKLRFSQRTAAKQ
jgi:hypothetical protein